MENSDPTFYWFVDASNPFLKKNFTLYTRKTFFYVPISLFTTRIIYSVHIIQFGLKTWKVKMSKPRNKKRF